MGIVLRSPRGMRVKEPSRVRLRTCLYPPAGSRSWAIEMSRSDVDQHLTRRLAGILAGATGVTVANNYYAQPLLPAIERSLHLSSSTAGLVVTFSQIGYAMGLIFLLPLGDLLERRRLVVASALAAAVALLVMARASGGALLLPAAMLVGAFSVLAQILVAIAAGMASHADRGQVVGRVMTGLLLGVLLARSIAGYLAALGGWRFVYYTASALMATLAIVLARLLPLHRPLVTMDYGQLLASVRSLFREEPVLRLRAVYGGLSFASFSILWTAVAFLLAGPPYHLGTGTIGLFGLIGAGGAIAASLAGRLADRGHQAVVTGVTAVLLLVSWLPLWVGGRSVAALVLGILILDVAAQGLHITNQSEIYRLRPDARSRINSAYMTSYFIGGAAGSAASAAAFSLAGWDGVAGCGAAVGALIVTVGAFTGEGGRRRPLDPAGASAHSAPKPQNHLERPRSSAPGSAD
jgi:predicted MFS family arabinose efflux permease